MTVSRRDFLQTSAAVAGGLATLELADGPALAENKATVPQRVLGRIKRRTSIIGYGTAPLGSDNTTPEEATRILNFALDQGINYLDTAPVYGDPNSKYGNAEMKLKEILKTRRNEVFLVTKANPGPEGSLQSRDGILHQIEASLKRMGVDSVDLVHIHNVGDFDMEKVFAPDGVLAGLRAAKERGLIRYLGTSGHSRPGRFAKVIETGEIDLTMNTLNFADRVHYDFEGLVIPAAKKHGTAVVAMKVLGGSLNWAYDAKTPGHFAAHHERAIRYSLGISGVSCAVIGFANEKEVTQALEIARHFKPLSAAERTALLQTGKELAQGREEYYGPVTG